MGAMNGMFQNPAFQKMAQSLMDNPEFKQKMDDMMKNETLMKEYAKIGEQVRHPLPVPLPLPSIAQPTRKHTNRGGPFEGREASWHSLLRSHQA